MRQKKIMDMKSARTVRFHFFLNSIILTRKQSLGIGNCFQAIRSLSGQIIQDKQIACTTRYMC